jgi:hypothetical protein
MIHLQVPAKIADLVSGRQFCKLNAIRCVGKLLTAGDQLTLVVSSAVELFCTKRLRLYFLIAD